MATRPEARSNEPQAGDAAVGDAGQPLMVARGIGGSLELYRHGVRIRREGYINFLLTWLAGRPAFVDSLIPLERISSFDIVEPVFFNDFVAISYGGGPPLSGKSLHDSTAENALLMNFFDNREFHALRRRYEEITGLMTARPLASPSSLRPSRRSS